MGDGPDLADSLAGRLATRRARIAEIRRRSRRLFDDGATGTHVAAMLSAETDAFLVDSLRDTCQELPQPQRSAIERNGAVIAVGGSGRGELAPYSDTDLLFLYSQPAGKAFANYVEQIVRDFWDAGLKLGHSVRTIEESIGIARQEPHVATGLVDLRLLWGNGGLFRKFRRKVVGRVIRRRRRAFIGQAITGRREEQVRHGGTVKGLEPDVKRSLGGLRDVHLIRWIGFAHYGTGDIDSLRLRRALSEEDARALLEAHEFLTSVRIDLHFTAGRTQDVLTREEQLRIAEQRKIEATAGLLPVERFMQTYFRHSTAIAEIADRFVALHQPRTFASRLGRYTLTHRAEGIFAVGPDGIDVMRRHRNFVLRSLEQILRLYYLAVLYDVSPTPELAEQLKRAVPALDRNISAESAELFLKILGCSGSLGAVLRSMLDVGLLELLIPDMSHARCLMQFNLYHSYTVDEHTLRAVEAAAAFNFDDGPLGDAHREMRHKELLHLALLLHDLGKGFPADHLEVGRQIAERTAERLGLSDRHRELLVFLVHHHSLMNDQAFRRDTTDLELLLSFSHAVGSPETLQMLYVFTAADLTAVGPGVWTSWKADLLTELYDRVMLILSGQQQQYLEHEWLEEIKQQVWELAIADGESRNAEDGSPLRDAARENRKLPSAIRGLESDGWRDWLAVLLDSFPPHYLAATAPERIAADVELIGRLERGGLITEGCYDSETKTMDYRIVTRDELADGCFHRITGALTAHRLQILSAHISTSAEGVVVDSFRVIDGDYSGEVPAARIDEIREGIRRVLSGEEGVTEMFGKLRRFGAARNPLPVSNLPMRVVIDNDSSDACTIIDVFALDRAGLQYTISRAIYQMGLSVLLAKIATHFDQVVDVFYVTDAEGQKIEDDRQLREIQQKLTEELKAFEKGGYRSFIS